MPAFDPYFDADLPHDPRPYLGPCDCHIRSSRALGRHEHGDSSRSCNSPDPRCPKCHGEGEIFGTVAA